MDPSLEEQAAMTEERTAGRERYVQGASPAATAASAGGDSGACGFDGKGDLAAVIGSPGSPLPSDT